MNSEPAPPSGSSAQTARTASDRTEPIAGGNGRPVDVVDCIDGSIRLFVSETTTTTTRTVITLQAAGKTYRFDSSAQTAIVGQRVLVTDALSKGTAVEIRILNHTAAGQQSHDLSRPATGPTTWDVVLGSSDPAIRKPEPTSKPPSATTSAS